MEDWVKIIIISAVVLIALTILILIIVAKSNSTNIGKCIWTDKKRTLFGLPISLTRYILTEKKLITRSGFFNLHEDECDLYRIVDKKIELPLKERMFNCGTIILTANDKDTPVKTIKSIKNVRSVQEKIDDLVESERIKYHVKGRDMIGYDRDCDCTCESDE